MVLKSKDYISFTKLIDVYKEQEDEEGTITEVLVKANAKAKVYVFNSGILSSLEEVLNSKGKPFKDRCLIVTADKTEYIALGNIEDVLASMMEKDGIKFK